LPDTDAPCPSRKRPHLLLEPCQSLGSNAPFDLSSTGHAEAKERTFCRSRHRALRFIDLELESPLDEDNEAVKRLSTGKGNGLSIGERIRSLGVKTKNAMPSMLVDGVSITPPTEDFEENISAETDAEANLELLGTTH
jgi:hypothetical protein